MGATGAGAVPGGTGTSIPGTKLPGGSNVETELPPNYR